MGLGKTIQSIAFIAHLKATSRLKLALIIVPLSLSKNWTDEFARFAPSINQVEFYGSRSDREQQKRDIEAGLEHLDVIVTTIETFNAASRTWL